MNPWEVIYRVAWVLLIILCVVGIVCIFLPKCRNYHEQQERKARLEEENRGIEAATRDIQMRQERFQRDKAFVERTAREQGMAKPGETVFRVAGEGATNPVLRGN
jgi:cell division protein FtsB